MNPSPISRYFQNVDILNRTIVVIIIIGILGSTISFLVFSRKTFASTSLSIYCRALAISECFMLIKLANGLSRLTANVDIRLHNSFYCKLYFYTNYGLSTIPGWILVAFSADMMFSISFPNKFNVVRKQFFQRIVVAFIVIFNCLLYLKIFFVTDVKEEAANNGNIKRCDFNSADWKVSLSIIYLIEASFTPLALLIITTVINIIGNCRLPKDSPLSQLRQQRDVRYSISSIVLNIVFFVLKMPDTLNNIVQISNSMAPNVFIVDSFPLFYVTYSVTFFVHLATNPIFRNEILIMSGIRKTEVVKDQYSQEITLN